MLRARLLAPLLLVGCTDVLFPARATMKRFREELTPLLAAEERELGPTVFDGDRLRLLEGALEVTFAVRREEGDDPRSTHLHAAARIDRQPLDICLYGASPADAAAAAAASTVPLFASAARRRPMLGVRRFWSSSAFGVPGRMGLVTSPWTRGAEVTIEGNFFADPPELPRDGRPHVLKAVVVHDGGSWKRSLELDGAAVEDMRPYPDAPMKASGPTVIVGLALLDPSPDPLDDVKGRARAMSLLDGHPAWLPTSTTCPADLAPERFNDIDFDDQGARGGRLQISLQGCEQGSSTDCYEAAQEVLRTSTSSQAQPLFLRACALGDASGCTNAAAGRLEESDCTFRTYRASCERGDDPWGCAMLGVAIARAEGPARDLERARAALRRACRFGPTDAACAAATDILEKLDATRSSSSGDRPPEAGRR